MVIVRKLKKREIQAYASWMRDDGHDGFTEEETPAYIAEQGVFAPITFSDHRPVVGRGDTKREAIDDLVYWMAEAVRIGDLEGEGVTEIELSEKRKAA